MQALPPVQFPTSTIRQAVVQMLTVVQTARLLRELQAPARGAKGAATVAGRPVAGALDGTNDRVTKRRSLTSIPRPQSDESPGAPSSTYARSQDSEAKKGFVGASVGLVPTPARLGIGSEAAEPIHSGTPRAVHANEAHVVAKIVAVEAAKVDVFLVTTVGLPIEIERERREAALVRRYVDWLATRDITAVRHEICLPGQVRPLYTDLFDPALSELLEAKASSERNDVRMALGQLLDYSRFVEHRTLAVLTPEPVDADLLNLLSRYSIANVYGCSDGRFARQGADAEPDRR